MLAGWWLLNLLFKYFFPKMRIARVCLPPFSTSLAFLKQMAGSSNKTANNKLPSWTLGKQLKSRIVSQALTNMCSQLPAVIHCKTGSLWSSCGLAISLSEHILLQTRLTFSKIWSRGHLSHGPSTLSHVNRAHRDYSSHKILTQLFIQNGSWTNQPTGAVIAACFSTCMQKVLISTAPAFRQDRPPSKMPFYQGLL